MSTSLIAHLYNAYRSGDAQYRQGHTTMERTVKIDDRTTGDTSYCFCDIEVTHSVNTVTLVLTLWRPPLNGEVEAVVRQSGGQSRETPLGTVVTIPIGPKDGPCVRRLAKAIRRVTRRGERYLARDWKWVAPRTADSLKRLAANLDEFRRLRVTQHS